MKRLTYLAIAAVAMLGLTACSDDVTGPNGADKANTSLDPTSPTIAELADAAGFNLLLDAVNYIAMTNPESPTVAVLLDDTEVTVFAPTDQAFIDLVEAVTPLLDADILEMDGPFAAIDALLGAGTIEAVVSYHVTGGSRDAASVVPERGEQEFKTLLNGATFMVTEEAMIEAVGNSATIVGPNNYASNGIVHAINAVILPIQLELEAERSGGGLDRVSYWAESFKKRPDPAGSGRRFARTPPDQRVTLSRLETPRSATGG